MYNLIDELFNLLTFVQEQQQMRQRGKCLSIYMCKNLAIESTLKNSNQQKLFKPAAMQFVCVCPLRFLSARTKCC